MKKRDYERICQMCGKSFLGYSSAKYCAECKMKKQPKKRKFVIPGKVYGLISVLSTIGGKPPKYTCLCEKCGNQFVATGQLIFRYENEGCSLCRRKAAEEKQIESYKNHIGETFGSLEIIEYAGKERVSQNSAFLHPVMKCRCLKCGNISKIPLYRLKSGHAKECAKCAQKNLKTGKEFSKIGNNEGTQIVAIDGRRSVNSNSNTGITGVSFRKETGKYRAYITFRRKQYYLGLYDNLSDAVTARKVAEKKIYGNFLEWYAKEHPEKWKKLKKNRD